MKIATLPTLYYMCEKKVTVIIKFTLYIKFTLLTF